MLRFLNFAKNHVNRKDIDSLTDKWDKLSLDDPLVEQTTPITAGELTRATQPLRRKEAEVGNNYKQRNEHLEHGLYKTRLACDLIKNSEMRQRDEPIRSSEHLHTHLNSHGNFFKQQSNDDEQNIRCAAIAASTTTFDTSQAKV